MSFRTAQRKLESADRGAEPWRTNVETKPNGPNRAMDDWLW